MRHDTPFRGLFNLYHVRVQRTRSEPRHEHSSLLNSESCLDTTYSGFVEVAAKLLQLKNLQWTQELRNAVDCAERCIEFVANQL